MIIAVIDALAGHVANDYFDIGLCNALAQHGCHSVLYANEKINPTCKINFEIKKTYDKNIYSQEVLAWWRAFLYIAGTFKAVSSAFARGINIVHYHFFHIGYLEFFNVAIAKLFARKIVVTLHDAESLRTKRVVLPEMFSHWMYSRIDQMIVLSKTAEKEALASMARDKVSLIPHGNYIDVVPELIEKSKARKYFGLKGGDFVCLFFGSINHHKGLDLLIQAVANLPDKRDIKLLIAGKLQKNHTVDYQKLAADVGVQDNCIFEMEFIPAEKMTMYFSAADLVVLPYRNIYQSGVLIMSMGYQRPVLVSDIEGMTEVIQHGKNGVIFKAGSVDDLSSKIQWAYNHQDQLVGMAESAFEQIKSQNSWTAIGVQTLACYRDLLNKYN